MSIYEEMLSLVPSQFRDKPKLNSILVACANQYEELEEVLDDINTKTTLETAEGQNLDNVGNIVSLSRSDAFDILRSENVLPTDDVYRNCIKFKIIENNGSATYEDVRKSLDLMWANVHKTYTESPSEPATYKIVLDEVDIDVEVDPATTAPLLIKPNGVQALISSTFLHTADLTDEEIFDGETIMFNQYAFFDGRYTYNGDRPYAPVFEEEEL